MTQWLEAPLPCAVLPQALAFVFCTALSLLGSSELAAQAGDESVGAWETRVDEDGLLVQTREVSGSKVKAFRGSVRVAATLEEVVSRIEDVDSYPDWFPNTIEARRLDMPNGERANYVRTAAPWPVKDRDAIYTQSVSIAPGRVRIDIGVAPDAVPEADGAVRVLAAGGFWDLTLVAGEGEGESDSQSYTQIVWEFHIEPGGNVPSSLVNTRIVDSPRKALQELREFFEGLRIVENSPQEELLEELQE